MTNNQKKRLRDAKRQLSASNKKKNKAEYQVIEIVKDRARELKEVMSTKTQIQDSSTEEDKIPYTLASTFISLKNITDDGVIETKNGRFLKILQIEPVPFFLKSKNERDQIILSFEQYLRLAPKHFQIKCISRQSSVRQLIRNIDYDKARETNEKILDYYEDQKQFITDIARSESVARNFYMIIPYQPVNRITMNDYQLAKQYLTDAEDTARKFLKVYDTSDSPRQEQAEMLYTILNRDRSINIPFGIHIDDFQDKWLATSSKNVNITDIDLVEYVSFEKLDFRNNKYVIVDGTYMSAIAISSNGYISDVYDAWFSMFTNFGVGIDVDLFVCKEDRKQIKNKVSKIGQIKSIQLTEAEKNKRNQDNIDSLSGSVASSKYIRDGLARKQDFFWINSIIYISAKDEETWKRKVKDVKDTLKGWEFKINTLIDKQEDAFRSYLPFCALDKAIFKATKQNVLTEGLASFFPFTSYEMTSEKGILFGIAEQNKSMVIADIFDTHFYNNANMLIFGTSGSGKTYLLMLIAGRFRIKHIPVCIITPHKGFEFARWCMAMGGTFIQISASSEKMINFMEIRPKDMEVSRILDGGVVETSLLTEKIQFLLILFSLIIPNMTIEEKQMLDEILIEVYKDYGITEDNNSIYNTDGTVKEMPIVGDVYDKLNKNTSTQRMAGIIKYLVTGSAKNFNRRTNVNLDNELIVIDTSTLSGELLAIGTLIGFEYALSKAKENRTLMKAIIYDEMWKFLEASNDPAINMLIAEYIYEAFKIIRGYGGAAIGATQNIIDVNGGANSKYGKGIINNSEIKIVLKLKPEEVPEVQRALGLSDDEAAQLTKFRHQGLYIANDNNIVVNIKSSRWEHKNITTDRKELNQILEEKRLSVQN